MSEAGRGPIEVADRSGRGRIWILGSDRARFLHNLTTNDVKRLAPGQGCEAFITSLQGRTLGFVTIHALEDAILLRMDPDVAERLMPHLAKYGALDDVEIEDRSASTEEVHAMGVEANDPLVALGREPVAWVENRVAVGDRAGHPEWLIAEAPLGKPGWTLIGQNVKGLIGDARWLDEDEREARRIEAATPEFGKDFTEANLPQELDRDARAISFVKGCYLGQETVARLDALGHVNKILRKLIFDTTDPVPPGAGLGSGGKLVGTATSTAFSNRRGRVIGLGMLRTSHAKAGTELSWPSPTGPVAVRVE
jgi:folate-binding protein YgfZ